MDKTFDDLFNEFFKRNKINPEDKPTDPIKDEAKKFIDLLTNMSKSIDENIEKDIDESLGKPDKTEFFDEDGIFYERRTWNTPHGEIVKLIGTDDPSLLSMPPVTKSLQEQLDEALATEDYEKAAAIRDKMNEKPKKTKKSK